MAGIRAQLSDLGPRPRPRLPEDEGGARVENTGSLRGTSQCPPTWFSKSSFAAREGNPAAGSHGPWLRPTGRIITWAPWCLTSLEGWKFPRGVPHRPMAPLLQLPPSPPQPTHTPGPCVGHTAAALPHNPQLLPMDLGLSHPVAMATRLAHSMPMLERPQTSGLPPGRCSTIGGG